MAEDTIALLNYVGWMDHRDLHVVAASLGGMISQGRSQSIKTPLQAGSPPLAIELAWRIPERIISLSLIVTTAGGRPWDNLPPVRNGLPTALISFC